MESSTVFSKIRSIAFCELFYSLTIIPYVWPGAACIMFTSFLWIVFLCFDIYVQWDISDRPERQWCLFLIFSLPKFTPFLQPGSLIVVILLANTMTVIILPILSVTWCMGSYVACSWYLVCRMLLPFRAWLDATRFMFLLLAHIGTSPLLLIILLSLTPRVQARRPRLHTGIQRSVAQIKVRIVSFAEKCMFKPFMWADADKQGVCKLFNLYILIASWVVPVLREFIFWLETGQRMNDIWRSSGILLWTRTHGVPSLTSTFDVAKVRCWLGLGDGDGTPLYFAYDATSTNFRIYHLPSWCIYRHTWTKLPESYEASFGSFANVQW